MIRKRLLALAILISINCGGNPVNSTPEPSPTPSVAPDPTPPSPPSVILLNVNPVPYSVIRPGDTVEIITHVYVPAESYPAQIWLQLNGGRMGFTCGHQILERFEPSGIRFVCRYPFSLDSYDGYLQYGDDQPLNLSFSANRLPPNTGTFFYATFALNYTFRRS